RLAERLLLAETIADVAQVTQRTGQMAFENVGVEIRSLAAADGLDEVAEMILAAAELLDNLALGRVGDGTTVARTNHVTVGALPDVADLGTAIILRFQATNLEDQFAIAVIEDANLRVGRLAVINVAEPTTDADDAFRQFILAQPPACLVHFMDALVAEIAVARVPNPMPIVMETLAHKRTHRRGAAPQIVVATLGRLLWPAHFADAAARLVAQTTRHLDFAELARVQEGHCFLQAGAAAALRTGLTDAIILASRLDDAATFADIVADRLFDIHIFAVLQRPNSGESVPVIGRGDGDDVDVFVFDDFANVLLELGRAALFFLDSLHGSADDGRVRVADGGDDGIELVVAGEGTDMAHTPAVNANDGDTQLIVDLAFPSGRGDGLFGGAGVGGEAGTCERGGGQRGILQKVTPIDRSHESSPGEGRMGR